MNNHNILKISLIATAFMIISATSYAAWNIFTDIDSINLGTFETITRPKAQIEAELSLAGEEPLSEQSETSESEIDASGWKVYRNKEYGLEVRYPEEWIQVSLDDRKQVLSSFEYYDDNNAKIASVALVVSFSNSTIDEFIEYKKEVNKSLQRKYDIDIVEINGTMAIREIYPVILGLREVNLHYLFPEKNIEIDINGNYITGYMGYDNLYQEFPIDILNRMYRDIIGIQNSIKFSF